MLKLVNFPEIDKPEIIFEWNILYFYFVYMDNRILYA